MGAVTDAERGLNGDPQWAVVGDIYPVGCKFSQKNIFPQYFEECPDNNDSRYNTRLGMYEEGTGLGNVMMSWGHDEYLYNICKNASSLPLPALYMIRYHSFYAWHKEGDYMYLCNGQDKDMLKWVKLFNK